jgi:hypothetical protein
MRIVLATLLLVGAAGFSVVSPPTSFLVGALPILVAFFLGWIRFAVDLVDLVAAELIADVAAPVAVALGFWLGTTGSTWEVAVVLVAGAAAQALPGVSRTRSTGEAPGEPLAGLRPGPSAPP